MKKEFEEDKITKIKLKYPVYKLDYFKEYSFSNPVQKSTEIYFNFIKKYGDLKYDFSKLLMKIKKKI